MRRLLFALLSVAVSTAFAGRRTVDLSGPGWTCDGEPIAVPHTWNAVDACDGPGETRMPRNGDSAASTNSYLRTSKTYARLLPRSKAGRRYFLRFEGASIKATVRVDGRPVGSHLGAFTAFAFEVTDFMKADREVRLEVDVDNRLDETTQPLSADFSVYGGLYRRVSLIETPPVCIDPVTDGADGVSLAVNTNGTVVATIHVLGGPTATETRTFRIPEPKLWTPETPNLYTQRVEIAGGDAVDVRFAFRTFEFRADGFYLNGVRRQLRGVNRHQDRAGKGWAVSPADEEADLRLIKEMGADALRTAHYPQSRHIYDLCDELGLICWVEYPNVNRLVFTETFERNVQSQVREMIRQLAHHPSIAMWGLWNELEMVGLGWNLDPALTRDFLVRLREHVRALDPTRPTVAATDRPQARQVNDVTDQLAYNRYPGWYSQEAMREMLDDMLMADDRPIVGMSEYGVGGSVKQHGDPSIAVPPAGAWHPEEYQAGRMHENLLELQREKRIWGHFVWAMFDFGADRRTEGETHGINDKGLVTADRQTKKDVYYLYRANWRPDVPTLHLVGSRMTETTADALSVLAFSNVGEVRLKVNGEDRGVRVPDAACGVTWKNVALRNGENEVEITAGGLVCRTVWRRVKDARRRTAVLGGTLEAVRAALTAKERGEVVTLYAPRPYLGEDRAGVYDLKRHPEDPNDAVTAELFDGEWGAEDAYAVRRGRGWHAAELLSPFSNRVSRTVGRQDVTTPFLIKRGLDRVLLRANVPFVTGAVAIDATTNSFVLLTRRGKRQIMVDRVIDCRLPAPSEPGEYIYRWNVVRGPDHPKIEAVESRIRLEETSVRALARAENEARKAAFAADLLDLAPFPSIRRADGRRIGATAAAAAERTTCDVLVVGGGTGGAPAALAAARRGAHVVVVEWLNVLGGVTTEGRIGGYYHGNRVGFTAELDRESKSVAKDVCLAKGEWYRRELMRHGAEVWFGALGYDVEKTGNRVTAVKVAFPDGRVVVVNSSVVVDATGNCDVAAAAGCETEWISAAELTVQGAGVAPQPLGLTGVNSDIGFVDETSLEDVSGFLLRARLSLPDRTWNVSQMVDSRERRRLVGVLRLMPQDILAARTFADTICETKSNFDTHGETSSDLFFVKSPGARGETHGAQLPYRCLLPKQVDGVLVTGLGVSAHRDAMPVLRMQPDIQNAGYAAGLAAAMAAKAGVAPRQIDVKTLQRELVKLGAVGEHVLTDTDGDVDADEVFRLADCPEILRRLSASEWDEGWNFKGMSQFGRSVSDVDAMLIALGRCRFADAVTEILRKAESLSADSAYSHVRALAFAAEGCGVIAKDRRKLARALHRILALPGVGGHSRLRPEPIPGYADAAADVERNLVLRELALARALYSLGDWERLGERTLEAYRRDYRRVYATHAEAALPPPAPEIGFHGVSDGREPMPERGGFAFPPVGWMTWYAVRFGGNEEIVLRNARAFKEKFGDVLTEKPILWVDWEWDHARFRPKDSDEGEDVLTPRASAYPRGLAPLAADLKALGFVPGLWVSCICDVRTNALLAARPEWLLPRTETWCGGVWGDPTAPGFCEEYIPRLFAAYRSWGYEAFKWDTLPHALLVLAKQQSRQADPRVQPREAIRRMVSAGRRAAGPAYLLSCSGETDAAVEACPDLFDAARIGADVWQWDDFVREGVDRFLKYAALQKSGFRCDMDNLVLREPYSTLAQARTRVILHALFGVPMTLGDEIADLDDARIELLRRMLPTFNVRPLSVGRRVHGEIFRTRVDFVRPEGSWTLEAFTNFETNRTLRATFSCPGRVVSDFWSGRRFSAESGIISLEIPACDTVLLKTCLIESR